MIFDLIPLIAVILSIIAISLVTLILSVNIYLKIRRYIPSSVNCWFCNTWTKVPYENRNSFDCPTCLQYNGFTKDGSYNKVIEAQHNIGQNKAPSVKTFMPSKNGLCDYCNRNQQLKITQLANFTPLIEKNFDVEIEHFRNQLEMAYKLCSRCSNVLKSTLLKEKATILGNHVLNIQKKGLKLLQLEPKQEVYIIIKILKCIQVFLAIMNMLNIIIQSTIFNLEGPELIPSFLLPYCELFQDLVVFIYNIMEELPLNLTLIVKYSYLQLFSSIGLIIQMISFLIESSIVPVKVNQLLCWSFLTLTSWSINEETIIFTHLFQVFCCILICYNIFIGFDINPRKQRTLGNLTKTPHMRESEYSDDDLEISSQYAKSSHSTKETLNPLNNRTDDDFTANKVSSWTARNLSNRVVYSNLRTSLEDLHLDNSIFNLSKCRSQSKESSPLSEKHKILSPSKLKNVTQNSWVAGGFWRNQNGTIMPMTDAASVSASSSLSSGFGSQVREPPSNFNNPFYSLPTSRNTSFCGNVDRFSLVSEPAYNFRSISPQSIWATNSYIYKSPSNGCHYSNSLRDQSTSNYKFNELLVPSNSRTQSPVSLYNTSMPFESLKLESCLHEPSMRNDLNDISSKQLNTDKF